MISWLPRRVWADSLRIQQSPTRPSPIRTAKNADSPSNSIHYAPSAARTSNTFSHLERLDFLPSAIHLASRTSTRHAAYNFTAGTRCTKTQPGPCPACASSIHHTAPPTRPTTTSSSATRTQRGRAVPGQQSGAEGGTCTKSDRSFGSPRLALQPALPGAAAHSGVRQHGVLWPPPPLERARPRRADQAHEPTRRLARRHRKKLG